MVELHALLFGPRAMGGGHLRSKTAARFLVYANKNTHRDPKPLELDSIKWPDSIECQPSAGNSPPSSIKAQLELRLVLP